MEACLAADAPPVPDEINTVTVSRMLTGSRAIPVALLRDRRFVFANPAFRSLFRAGTDIIGMPLMKVIATQGRAAMSEALSDPSGTAVTFRGRAVRLDGTSFDVEFFLARETLDGVPTTCVFGEDVTWRQISERHLSDLAYTDPLTGLPNRALALDRLRDAVVEARSGGSALAVLMADVDGLKRANDTYGHQAGDVVLQVTAQRLLGCVRERDTLARLGGDEFCIVLPRVSHERDAEMVAARLVEAARQPILINGQEICVGVSVGIALFPKSGTTLDEMIAAADAALYQAKRGGRNRFVLASAQGPCPVASSPLIMWTSANDLGIAIMDKQHRQLADHLNDLAAALRRGDDPSIISNMLTTMFSCTRHHFECEERLMDEFRFAGATAHRESHARLLDDLENFSARCDTRSLTLTTRFLQEWLLRHIDSADRGLAVALKSHGIR